MTNLNWSMVDLRLIITVPTFQSLVMGLMVERHTAMTVMGTKLAALILMVQAIIGQMVGVPQMGLVELPTVSMDSPLEVLETSQSVIAFKSTLTSEIWDLNWLSWLPSSARMYKILSIHWFPKSITWIRAQTNSALRWTHSTQNTICFSGKSIKWPTTRSVEAQVMMYRISSMQL